MKKFIIFVLIITLTLSLCSCAQEKKEINNVTSEIVEAIIIGTHTPYRGTPYIEVVYQDTSTCWYGREYYQEFSEDIGFYIRCILMTYNYKDGSVKKELIYNREIYNGGELK